MVNSIVKMGIYFEIQLHLYFTKIFNHLFVFILVNFISLLHT